jgi:DNA-binding GntR family transcriptional regulator
MAKAREDKTGPALVDAIAQAIQADVLSGSIASGTKLRQEALATRFGVSRTPIREALRKLEAARVIEVIPRRGALIRTPTTKEIRDAYLVRSELEGLAADLAARWIHDEQIAELRRADELFSRAVHEFVANKATAPPPSLSADVDWIRANDLFHEVIFEAAGNELLTKLIGDLHQVFPRQLTWFTLSRDSHLLSSNVVQHRQIREAIERRDGVAARTLMTNHVQRAGELVVINIERSRETRPGIHQLTDGY